MPSDGQDGIKWNFPLTRPLTSGPSTQRSDSVFIQEFAQQVRSLPTNRSERKVFELIKRTERTEFGTLLKRNFTIKLQTQTLKLHITLGTSTSVLLL